MSKYPNCTQWLFLLGFTVGLATAAQTHAADSKPDLDAEAKQSAQEDADEIADHAKGIRGKRAFYGTFAGVSTSEELGPDVVGSFTTNASDKKPGRKYLVKVEDGNKAILKALMRYDGKTAQVVGKLRIIDQDGEAKYLIVSAVLDSLPTPPTSKHGRLGGGL